MTINFGAILDEPRTDKFDKEIAALVKRVKSLRLKSVFEDLRVLILCDTHTEQYQFINAFGQAGIHINNEGNFQFEVVRMGMNPMREHDILANHFYISREALRILNNAKLEWNLERTTHGPGAIEYLMKNFYPEISVNAKGIMS